METTEIDLETPDDLLYRPKQEFSELPVMLRPTMEGRATIDRLPKDIKFVKSLIFLFYSVFLESSKILEETLTL